MRFNQKLEKKDVTVNYEGEKAYQLNNEMELYSIVVNSMVSDQFYRNQNKILERLEELIKICDSNFIQKLGVYAREKMYLRTIPLVMAVYLAKYRKLDKKYVTRIIQRADELAEILGFYKIVNGKLKPIANSLKMGIANSFLKFDEYQFDKYYPKEKEKSRDIKLRDIMFLVHPNPGEEKKELYKKIVNHNLKTSYTWEVELFLAEKRGKTKGEVWIELIESNRVGIMAMLRNLKNILLNVPENRKDIFKKVADFISNEQVILKSKQLPFRFFSAYREIQEIDSIYTFLFLNSLEKAAIYSIKNIKGFDDKILMASDVSGSMEKSISEKSKIRYWDIGIILPMLLQLKCEYCITGVFGTTFKIKQFPKNNFLGNVSDLRKISHEVGWSTNGYKVIDYAIENNKEFDKIILFTDCEMWDSESGYNVFNTSWYKYKNIFPDCKLYLFNLAGYGTTPVRINEKDVFMISGWSDRIFDMLYALENGKSIIEEINKIEV